MTLLEAEFLILVLEKDESKLLFFIDKYADFKQDINSLHKELEEKLNAIKIDVGILSEIFKYLGDNQKIMAVKLCISQLGHTLMKAKTFTDKLETDFSNFFDAELLKPTLKNHTDAMLQTCAATDDEIFIDRIIALLRKKKKIEAVKLAKETKKIGLKEAKEFVETFNIRLD